MALGPAAASGDDVAFRVRRGFRPVLITGDHPLTARHVAREVGIADDERFVLVQELETLSETGLRRSAAEVAVFVRVAPEHKLRLVRAYQAEGNVVAMTGDGVDDAPSAASDLATALGATPPGRRSTAG